jgi:hypothetical protein
VTDKQAQRKLSKDQVTEWFESPVTEYFFALVTGLKGKTKEALAEQGFDTESAEQLMARRGNLWGMHTAFETVEEVFEDQSFEQIEEEESGEQVGDSSPGRPGTH